MLISYLKIFLRLLGKQGIYSAINVLGLAFGMACCLLVALFVRHELSYDRFFADAERLYRVSLVAVDPAGVEQRGAAIFYPVAPLLEQNFPEIDAATRIKSQPSMVSRGGTVWLEDQFKLVDANFFQVFDLFWLEEDPDSAYTGPTDAVLTRSLARKYFGADDAVGQTLDIADGVSLRVTGVIEDLPDNTHLRGSAFVSMALRNVIEPEAGRNGSQWYTEAYHTYVRVEWH